LKEMPPPFSAAKIPEAWVRWQSSPQRSAYISVKWCCVVAFAKTSFATHSTCWRSVMRAKRFSMRVPYFSRVSLFRMPLISPTIFSSLDFPFGRHAVAEGRTWRLSVVLDNDIGVTEGVSGVPFKELIGEVDLDEACFVFATSWSAALVFFCSSASCFSSTAFCSSVRCFAVSRAARFESSMLFTRFEASAWRAFIIMAFSESAAAFFRLSWLFRDMLS
jgi:hypothetical protein